MPNKYASGKHSIAECDRCSFRYKLAELRTETIKTHPYHIKVCRQCWNFDHPQLQVGMFPVDDPQAVRDPRPDISYAQGGQTGLQTKQNNSNDIDDFGYPTDGSRQFQWGYNPVGGSGYFDRALTPNSLIPVITIGTVSIITT